MDNAKNSSKIKLPKKEVQKACFRFIFFSHCAQNFERMMGLAFTHMMVPILKLLYKDPEEYQKALVRHMQFFNTEPNLGSIIPGITIALEEQRANGQPISEDLIVSTKNALMGPFAGLGDSIIIGTYMPILLSIALGLSDGGSPLGAIFYIVVWLGSMIAMRYWLFMKGYKLGIGAAKSILQEGLSSKVTQALNIVGLITIGGVSASFVKVPVRFIYESGEMSISLQSIFDKIMPKLLPLVLVLLVYYLIDKKGWSVNKVILSLLAFVSVMVAVGIM
ncbi:PTS system mannose/fructose/sorbose family transporter subunit IID [Abyssisolibacter fermentans]|uniref:PTS system mannose/fructose/sorbose family transporter subunit IID n=1 Tax=Abyssisolibacter fermentans TaxID=1766203 RepID=UPI000830417A|nr:PTS system mannose/fructose/sorbose family transporter subunit IID [Abyssisolibacter fermentans]